MNDKTSSDQTENSSTDEKLRENASSETVAIKTIVPLRERKPRDQAVHTDYNRPARFEFTQKTISQIEKVLGMPIFAIYTGLHSAFVDGDVGQLYYHLSLIGKTDKLGVVLFGPGGNPTAAYRAAKLLRSFAKHVTFIVPEKAASAFTMLSISADELLTGPLSAFSPVDSSVANHPLAPRDPKGNPIPVEVNQVYKFLELVNEKDYKNTADFRNSPFFALTDKVHPLFLGTIQRTLSLSQMVTRQIARMHIKDESQIEQIVKTLNDNYPTHSFPILPEDLRAVGIKVREMSPELNDLAISLVRLYDACTAPGEKVQGDERQWWRTHTIFETRELRSYAYGTVSDRLVDKTWVRTKDSFSYEHAAVVKNKKGFYESLPLSSQQFQQWLSGQEVESS